MKFSTPINFTLLTDLLKSYGDVDEIVFKSHSSLDEHRIAEICRESGRLSGHLKLHHPGRNAIEIAAQLGISVQKDSWEVAGGKVIYTIVVTIKDRPEGLWIALMFVAAILVVSISSRVSPDRSPKPGRWLMSR